MARAPAGTSTVMTLRTGYCPWLLWTSRKSHLHGHAEAHPPACGRCRPCRGSRARSGAQPGSRGNRNPPFVPRSPSSPASSRSLPGPCPPEAVRAGDKAVSTPMTGVHSAPELPGQLLSVGVGRSQYDGSAPGRPRTVPGPWFPAPRARRGAPPPRGYRAERLGDPKPGHIPSGCDLGVPPPGTRDRCLCVGFCWGRRPHLSGPCLPLSRGWILSPCRPPRSPLWCWYHLQIALFFIFGKAENLIMKGDFLFSFLISTW